MAHYSPLIGPITALSMAHSMPLFDVRFVPWCPFCPSMSILPSCAPYVPMPLLYQAFTYPAHVVARNIGRCESAPYPDPLCTPYAVGIPLPLSTHVPHHVPIQPSPHTPTMYLPLYHYTTHHILCTNVCTTTHYVPHHVPTHHMTHPYTPTPICMPTCPYTTPMPIWRIGVLRPLLGPITLY